MSPLPQYKVTQVASNYYKHLKVRDPSESRVGMNLETNQLVTYASVWRLFYFKYLDVLVWRATGSAEPEGTALSSTTCKENEELANACAVSGLSASQHFSVVTIEAVVSHSVAQTTPTLHAHHSAGTAVFAAVQWTRTAEKFLSADSSVYPTTMEKGVLIQNRSSARTGTINWGERSGHWKSWHVFPAWETEAALEGLSSKAQQRKGQATHAAAPSKAEGSHR